MSYDAALADRIRELIGEEPGSSEKKMFGGLAFLVNGNMAVAASGQGGILLRVDPDESETLVSEHVQPAVMRGRPMAGWLRIDTDHLGAESELARWVGLGVAYARSLPPKR